MAEPLTLRPAVRADLPAVAALYLATRAAAVPAMPPIVHTPDEVRAYVDGWDLAAREVWVAEDADGGLAGFACVDADWLESLYVAPGRARAGVGSALLDVVKSLRPGGFALWVFAANRPARDFYARHGLVDLEHTDGSDNEERTPDLRMAWLGGDPAAYLRDRLAEVDHDLAVLRSRREALLRVTPLSGTRPGGV